MINILLFNIFFASMMVNILLFNIFLTIWLSFFVVQQNFDTLGELLVQASSHSLHCLIREPWGFRTKKHETVCGQRKGSTHMFVHVSWKLVRTHDHMWRGERVPTRLRWARRFLIWVPVSVYVDSCLCFWDLQTRRYCIFGIGCVPL